MKIKTMLLSLLVILMVVLLAAGIIKLEKQVSQIENDGLEEKIGLLEKEIDYLKNQLSIKEEQTTRESIKNTESNQITDINWDDTDSWKTYENKDLGFSFKYPAEFGDFSFFVNDSQGNNQTAMFSGKEYYGNFDNIKSPGLAKNYLALGGVTSDFQKGTEGNFYVFVSYYYEEGKYYSTPINLFSNQKISINPTKILSVNNKEILLLERKIVFGEVHIEKGAYINLNNGQEFKGMAIENMTLTQEQFEKILSTFSFAK